MNCQNCGKELSEEENFCPNCDAIIKGENGSDSNENVSVNNHDAVINKESDTPEWFEKVKRKCADLKWVKMAKEKYTVQSKKTKRIIAGSCVVILLLCIIGLSISSNVNRSPETAVNGFFDAVYHENYALLNKVCLYDNLITQEELSKANKVIKNEADKNWRKETKIVSTKKESDHSDYDVYMVTYRNYYGEKQTITVYRDNEDHKYYVYAKYKANLEDICEEIYEK